jgi:membrane fusion protein (multidrug efflux system)
MPRSPNEIFRQNALQHAAGQSLGDVLRLTPVWTRRTYPVLVAALVVGVLYCTFGTLHEYATGPAVVWISGRSYVTATVPGTVSKIEVRPGERVEAGRLLVTFASTVELADLRRIDQEFETQLAKSLRDPSDQAARTATAALRTARDVAVARLEQHSIRAPQAGLVGDIRIRPGQLLQAGEIVLTLVGDDGQCSVQAVLPAQYRPQLRPGMSLRFEVAGYSYAYQELKITSVSAQIIGPNEVRRFLGQEIEDTMKVEGPVVLVEAAPCPATFVVDGQTLDFYHGMSGVAEARVRTQRILIALVPALRVVFGNADD